MDTEMQARFSFSNERQASLVRRTSGNKTRHDSRLAHHTLLGTLLSIWVIKDKLAGRLEVFPKVDSVEMSLFDVFLRTLI